MEETKNTQTASQPEKSKKEAKQEKKSSTFLAEHKAELRKVVWPNRQELIKETVTVIVVSLLVGVIIYCMDTVLSLGYDKLMSLGNSNTASSDANGIDLSTDSDLVNVEAEGEGSSEDVEVNVVNAGDEAADTEASAKENAETPAEENAEAPAEENAEAPAEENAEASAEENAEAPAEENAQAPAAEDAETPESNEAEAAQAEAE